MISEPELDGEWGPERPAAASEADAEQGPLRRPPGRRWGWALGGAVLASAVWAGALTAQDRFTASGPPVAYRHAENLCAEGKPATLGSMAGGLAAGPSRQGRSPALDWSYCGYHSERTEGRASFYDVQVLVELHRRTDPGTEFGSGPVLGTFLDVESADREEIPGLGERALVTGEGGAPRLQVLDGGAVFTLTVHRWREGADGEAGGGGADDGEEADGDALRAAMAEDLRELMARLKK